MTCELFVFSTTVHNICQFVFLADGSAFFVRHTGDVSLSPTITLSSVLHIPNFAYNL